MQSLCQFGLLTAKDSTQNFVSKKPLEFRSVILWSANENCYAAKKMGDVGSVYISMIEYPKNKWLSAFGYKRLCYNRTTAGTFMR